MLLTIVNVITSSINLVDIKLQKTLNLKINFFILANTHTLDDFICMTTEKGPGNVFSLSQFVQKFYKQPIIVSQEETA